VGLSRDPLEWWALSRDPLEWRGPPKSLGAGLGKS
jgi:hypothetical protein